MWLDKFRLLCWKNFTLQKRHPIAGAFEILFPIILVAITVLVKNNLTTNIIDELKFPGFQPLAYEKCLTANYGSFEFGKVGISPNTSHVQEFVQGSIGKALKKIEYFNDTSGLNDFLSSDNQTVAGIEFHDVPTNASEWRNLRYTIRLPYNPSMNAWFTDQVYFITLSKASRDRNNIAPSTPPYNSLCFLTIQNDIDRAFMAREQIVAPSVTLRRFPYPSVKEDPFTQVFSTIMPLLIMMSMLMSLQGTIRNITTERETKMKETMKMMGLSSNMHWLAWFTKSIVMKEISVIAITFMMCSTLVTDKPIFLNSNAIIIWLFFSIYVSAVIVFCFFIGVIFKKSSTAVTVGAILFFVTFMPFSWYSTNFYALPYIVKLLFCMMLNAGMGQGLLILLVSESDEVGVGFMNLFSRAAGLNFSVGEVMLVMIFAALVQLMMTFYIEKVFPGDIGVPRPWYYPATSVIEFVRHRLGYNTLVNRDAAMQDRRYSGPDYEDEPENLKAGIRISNLSKTFGNKAAVDKLCMNIYEDQITVLLGHNGAGKTTTMSMLTGMFQPTSGTAYLNGKDIRTEIDEARESLGLCPQTNILFDELTVKEHIIFFARLKGIKGNREIAEEVRRYVNLLELQSKIDAQSRTLSGGMKRKLSIGIALCGNSKIVVCDEPSSGMDPAGRRALWDLLIAEKQGRTILISTHHMDEADILGDRIAIMSTGKLRTAGSSFFLKKKFGTGYKLICVKKPECDPAKILRVVQEFAPNAFLQSDAQTEAVFTISEDHLPIFQHIFRRLEDKAEELKISSFGCSLSTLEEVFLKLGTESHEIESEQSESTVVDGPTTIIMDDTLSGRLVKGSSLMFYQAEAMFLKKVHYQRRNFKSILWLIVISSFLTFTLMKAPPVAFFNSPARDITFASYDNTMTLIESDGSNKNLVANYSDLLGGKDSMKVIANDMASSLLEASNSSIAIFNHKYMIAATIKIDEMTAWFNAEPYHALPLTLNTINRAILRTGAGKDFDISVTNKPYAISLGDSGGYRPGPSDFDFLMPLILIFVLLVYWPGIFIGFYIKERDSRAKLLQLISGVNRYIYWASSFLFDFALYLIVISVITIAIGAFQKPHLSTAGELGTIFLIMTFYGISTLPLIFAFSYLFKKFSTGESMVTFGAFLLGLLYGVYQILKYTTEAFYWKILEHVLYWVGLSLGPFSLVDCLVKYGLSLFVPNANLFTFTETGICLNLLMMSIGGVFFMTICLLDDHMLFDWFIYKFMTLKRKLPEIEDGVDADVKEEADRIRNLSKHEIAQGNLVLNGLTKYYSKHLAVNQLHLAVGASECFGLLGINGAGKTTTFKMMTGDEIISAGDAFIRGNSMTNQMNKVHQMIGYCPQFDALLVDLTGRETLRIFALIRGIPKRDISDLTTKLSNQLGFYQHLDKKIYEYSGGNKRKFSVALALIGDPKLVFLDEPTTGMDPGAKRQLWNMINRTRNSGRSIVMTSHSMEECEALCTKIAIMVNGEFKCLGSTQHLKNKFSKGFILTIKAGRNDDETTRLIRERVQALFTTAMLKEHYLDILTFHITESPKWSEIFAMMAQMKTEMELADYALSQTSLEQVFLFFTKKGLYQRDSS